MKRSSLALGLGSLVIVVGVCAAVYLLSRPQAPTDADSLPAKPALRESGASARLTAGTSGPDTAMERKPGLPDPAITPGERLAKPQPEGAISEAAKKQVFAAYKVPPGEEKAVACRLIPASLGGTSNPKNLFATTPWFADLKARLDKYLTDQVKAGKMTVEQAEKELKSNWIQAVHTHNIRNYGAGDAQKAKEMEEKLRW